MQGEVADKVVPVVEEDETEAIKETAPYNPVKERLFAVGFRRQDNLHCAECNIDAAEDKEQISYRILQDLQSLGKEIDEFINNFLNRTGKVVGNLPVIIGIILHHRIIDAATTARLAGAESWNVVRRIHILSPLVTNANFKVQMWSCGDTRITDAANELPFLDNLTIGNKESG